MARRAWTGTERKLVRDHYVSEGAPWCAERLNRTTNAVRMFALKQGFTRPDTSKKSSPQIDAFLRRAYEAGRGGPAQAARTLGVSVQWVARRGAELGLAIKKRDCRPYTEAEAKFVEEHAHLNRATISKKMREKGWRRTAASIQSFIEYGRIQSDGYITPEALALGLGVSSNAIRTWRRNGDLIGQARGRGSDENAGTHVYKIEEVACFIVRNRGKIDLRKVDGPWFIDILAKYGALALTETRDMSGRIVALKADNPFRTNAEIAEIVGSNRQSVAVQISKARKEGLLPPADPTSIQSLRAA